MTNAFDKPTPQEQEIIEIIEFLGGPDVWGALNQGQSQCNCCMAAYIGVEDAIDRLRTLQKRGQR